MRKSILMTTALLMGCLAVLSSCSEAKVEEDTSADSAVVSEPTISEEEVIAEEDPTVTSVIDEKYGDTDLGGYEYSVLAISTDMGMYSNVQAGLNEVYAEEITGDLLNDAIFTRNLKTEDKLNIKVTPVWGGSPENIKSQVHTEVLAGISAYDAILNRMDYLGTNM